MEAPWVPVIAALRELEHDVSCSESANLVFATQASWARMQVVYGERNGSRDMDRIRAEAFEPVDLMCRTIGRHLDENPRRMQPEFLRSVERCLYDDSFRDLTVFTTNWDRSLRDLVGADGPTVFPLHGQVGEGLYLPSEIAGEVYRPLPDRLQLVQTHRTLHHWMKLCDHLIIYGLSLSPLDAELALLIKAHAVHLGIATIVDPRPEYVAARLRALRGSASFPIVHLDPTDPEQLRPERIA